ncbi:MAG: PAS domain S-box protein [Gallionella sp.]
MTQIEAQLKFYQALMKYALDGIHVMDAMGNVIEVNDTFCKMLGYSQEEALKLNVADWNAQWSREELLARFKKFAGQSARFETLHRRKDGTLINVEVSTTGLDIEGQPYFISSSRDITDLKRIEKQLSHSEQKFRKVFHDSPDPMVISEIDTGVVSEINKSFTTLFGYSEEDVIGRTTNEFGLWLDEASRNEIVSKIKMEGSLRNQEIKHRTKDGRILTLLASSSQLNVNGTTSLVVHFRDITERKRTEEALLKTQRLLSETELVGKVGGWELHIDTGKLEWTQGAYNIHEVDVNFKLTVEKAINFYTPASRPIIEQAVNRAIANGEPFDVELEIITAKGSLRNVHAIGSVDLTNHRVYGFIQDISARKQAEISLHESEIRFRTIVEQSPIGISLSRDGYTTDVNSVFLKMFGYNDVAEVRGTPVINRIAPQCRAEMEDRIKRRSQDYPAESTYETIGLRKDGSQFPMFISAQRLMLKDGSISSAFLIDFTDRKRAEAEHLVAMEAAAANRAKSEFLAGMSHELRTPLNAILGFGQLLEMDPQISSPEQQEWVSHILSAGQQLLELINDLLDFAQIDIGKLRLNLQSLSMAELTAICVAQIKSAMAQHKHVVIKNNLTDPALRVQGDNQRVRQVLINLLSNAVKYNKDDGRITVSGRITPEGRLRIAVSDTGFGIATDKLPLLFTPFERIGQSHGTISGVGIGLAITRQLVEAMQGSIGVESVLGQGSTFWFELPVAQEAHEAKEDSQKASQLLQSGDARFVVLYIEDNPVNLRLVQAALKDRPGVELFTTETAETGLTFAAEDHPDLILIDIWLPGMDGITATTLLKKNDATRDIPVVALSAAAQPKDIDRALNAGCSDYLTKPIDLQALYQLIDKFRSAK